MTLQKRRAPLSVDGALARIAGQVPGDWGAMGEDLGLRESIVRAWGDPDRRERIPFECAIKLDILFRAHGGDGWPMFETYAYQLDESAKARFVDEIVLGRLAAIVIRECGEASSLLVLAAQPGADRSDFRETRSHVQEAIDAYQRASVLLAALENGGHLDPATVLDDLVADHRATGPPTP